MKGNYEHLLKRPAHILKQATTFAERLRDWYDKPFQIKKSTLIILGLIVYILWSHVVQAMPVPASGIIKVDFK